MTIKINSVSPLLVPPFAICSDGGHDFVITARGKHPVRLMWDGNDVTIDVLARRSDAPS